MAAGNALTVTENVVVQPAGIVYVTVATPAPIPVTTPEALIVAIVEGAMLHIPRVLSSVNVIEDPTQTESLPVIVAGEGLTVMLAVVSHPAPDV